MAFRFPLLLLLFVLTQAPALAHLTPNSELKLHIGPAFDRIDIIVPQGEYGYASGNPIGDVGRARAWLAGNFSVAGPDLRAWRIDWETVEFVRVAGPPDLHGVARLTPPANISPRAFTLEWTGVIDRVPSHFALVVIGTDFAGGRIGREPMLVGALQGARRSIAITRDPPSMAAGFAGAVRLGTHHIAEGHDHLLFLLTLLLPAPVLAGTRRWRGARPVRSTLAQLAWIVSAFTIGHSLTLIASAFLGWRLPAPPVECLIALSILISAIHAWRPIFAGREAFVAAGFGLIHGLAFATVVGNLGLGRMEKALTILGFNIGIELVQLAVVAAVVPGLVLMSRTHFYDGLRISGAVVAGVAAAAWLAERLTARDNAVGRGLDAALAQAPWLVLAITLLAASLYCREIAVRRSSPQP